MSAALLYHSKVHLVHRGTDDVAVAELKVWQVAENNNFPEGIKYSLFLVNLKSGDVVIGYDNHKPKGHHVHIGDTEQSYLFRGVDQLIDDFWLAVEERGYLVS